MLLPPVLLSFELTSFHGQGYVCSPAAGISAHRGRQSTFFPSRPGLHVAGRPVLSAALPSATTLQFWI